MGDRSAPRPAASGGTLRRVSGAFRADGGYCRFHAKSFLSRGSICQATAEAPLSSVELPLGDEAST